MTNQKHLRGEKEATSFQQKQATDVYEKMCQKLILPKQDLSAFYLVFYQLVVTNKHKFLQCRIPVVY